MKKLYRKVALAKSGKRLLALCMSVCMIGTILPTTVLASESYTFTEGYALSEEAEELTVTAELRGAALLSEGSGVTYRTCDSDGKNWTTKTCTSATEVTSADTAWGTSATDKWYVVNGTMTIGSSSSKIRISVSGNVHLILTDGCSLTIKGGIEVMDGNSLTIYGQAGDTGTLSIQNVETNNAGIGSAGETKCGSITINGGKVTAKSGGNGAGIGSGNQGEGGTITINGGTVTANGSGYSAGIGGGSRKSGGTITINGGTVNATGGASGGAGIGGGEWGDGGTITISGGTITATGDRSGGAGIGGGGYAGGGNIAINGGTVTATGGSYGGAGIGGGAGGASGAGGSGGNITISGGTVTATGGTNGGAGIGGGGRDDGKIGGNGGSITISGGIVTATGGTNGGAGIGAGKGGSGGTVAISDSFVMAGSISDTGSQESWSGLIFVGEAGKVYGDSVNISMDCTIPSGKSLEVAADQTISIADTKTLTNAGTIYNSGTFTGTVTNTDSGNIHNTGTISSVSGGTINQYSIEPTKLIAGTSAALALKVNGSDASVGSVAYTLDANEVNAELIDGTLRAEKNIGSKIPVTATFTVDTVSMTRTEEITITECDVHSYGDFDGNGFRVCSVCGKDDYQLANVVSATHHPELMDEHANYYAIENAGQLYWFAQQVNTVNTSMNAILTSDITVNSGASAGAVANCNGTKAEGWRDWTPIGIDSDHRYSGIFDGNGHTVSGLYFNDSNTDFVGLFGKNEYIIKNVGVIDSYFRGRSDVGGVCGANYDTITNCYNTSTVSGAGSSIGGVCGENHSDNNKITNCYSIGKVSGAANVGAVCGTGRGFVENCYYLAESADENGGKTEEQFRKGEVAYLLSQGCKIEIFGECYAETFTYDGSIWGQTLADVNRQDYPALGGDKVFRNEKYAGCEANPGDVTYVYSNTEKETVYIPHSYQISTDGMYHECTVGQEKIYHSDVAKFISNDEANTITGTCTECGDLGTVTLIAPTGNLTYNGTAREATVDASKSVLKGAIDIAYNTSDGNAPKDAGSYTASITLGTGDNAATVSVNYTIAPATPTISWGMSSGTSWVELTEILVTYTGAEIAPDKLVPQPTVTLVNGETYSGEISYSYRVQGSSDAFTSGLPTEIGTYEVKASIAADGNYKEAASTVKLTVNWLNTVSSATLTDQGGSSLSGNDWWAQSVTFTAPNGYTISNSLNDSFGTSFVYNEQTDAHGTEVIYFLKDSDGKIAKKTTTVRIDTTAPDWNGENDGISIKTNKWKALLSTISFGLFYKDAVDVEVRANDSLSGVAAYYYYVDSTGGTVKTAAQLDDIRFTKYTGDVSGQNPTATVTSLVLDGNYIVYAYAEDAVGNRSAYVCSEGVVVDSTEPVISNIVAPSKEASTLTDTTAQISFTGSEVGTYFYVVKESSETAPDSITDFATSDTDSKGMTTWTAKDNVSSATMTAAADNEISLNGLNANTAYTLYLAAVDLAGNSSIIYSQSFKTCRTIPTVAAADMPIISGTYGQTVKEMTMTPGTAKFGSTVITGKWTVTDSSAGTAKPSVGTTDTYQVTFTPDTSYNGKYDTVNVQVIPVVAPKRITVTAENKTKTYGKANPVLTFTVPDGALVGNDTKDNLRVTLSCKATETSPVGGYAITGTASSANYEVTVIQGTLTITKADAQITIATGKDSYSKTFGDAAFTLSGVSDTNTEANVQYEVTAGNDVVSVSNGTVTIKKAGTATITVSLPASTNYNAATNQEITVTVAKKSGYTVAAINKSYLCLRDNAATIDLSGNLPTNCGPVTYGVPQVNGDLYTTGGQPAASADGKLSYTVKAGSVGDNGTIKVAVTTDNYADFTVTVNVKLIDKLPVSLKNGSSVTLQNNTLTYGEALSKLAFNSAIFVDADGKEVKGSLAWKDAAIKPNVGTTSAEWLFTPDNIEYAAADGTIAITVEKATPNVTAVPTVAGRTYAPAGSLTDADLTGGIVTDVDGNPLGGSWSWQTANIIPIVNNSGYVAVFTPTDSTNYNTVTRTITVTVTKATPYIKTAPTASAITYGDTLGASALTVYTVQYSESDATTVAGSFTWKDSSVKPSVSGSSNTTYRVVFTPSDADNYNTVETDITLTVNKADNAPNMPSSTMNVVNSCTKVSDVTLPTGWLWQDADKDTALTAGTAVTATAVYNGADKGNYVNETISVTITRVACDHTAGAILYTGVGEHQPTCTVDGIGHKVCTKCGEVMESGIVVKASHSFGSEWIIDKEATTSEEGSKSHHCMVCEEKTDVTAIPKLVISGGGDSGNSSGSSGGSSGGTDGSNSGNATSEVTTGKDSKSNVTTTTAPTKVKVTSGTASATVKTENVKEAIKQAEENKSAEIVFTVSKKDIKNADTIQLTMTKSLVQQLIDKTDADLVVATSAGDVTLSQHTLAEVVAVAGGKTLTVEVEKVSAPSTIQKKLAGENACIVDVTITSNKKAITTFGGNTLQIKLEIPSSLKSKKVAAVCITDDGKVEKLSGKKVTEGTKMYYEFTTTHLSTFALVDRSTVVAFNPPKKGTQLTDSSTRMVYKVTKSGAAKGTVQFIKAKSTKVTTVAIPDSVTIDGITYKVTSIASGAFSNCSKLKKVTIGSGVTTIGSKAFYKCTALTSLTIPSTVTKIGDYAFKGCKKLTSIKINSTKLTTKTVSEKAFSGVSTSAVIKVPKSKLESYEKLFVKKGLSKKVKIQKK